MTAEYAINGIYFASIPVTALIALVAMLILRRLLVFLGAYRWIWHPALFDMALFVCLWALLVASPFQFLAGNQP